MSLFCLLCHLRQQGRLPKPHPFDFSASSLPGDPAAAPVWWPEGGKLAVNGNGAEVSSQQQFAEHCFHPMAVVSRLPEPGTPQAQARGKCLCGLDLDSILWTLA